MEGPASKDEASIPTEPESMIMSMSGTTSTLKRKVCTKTCVTKLTAANILLPSPAEDIPARKKPRLQIQASLPAIAAEADMDPLIASPDAGVAAPVAPADAGTYPMAARHTQPNVGATRAPPRRWSLEDDTKLTSAVKTTCKKKHHGEYRTDWAAVAALVPGRRKQQCKYRWHVALASKSDETSVRIMGPWTTEEDNTLKDAVQKHNGKDWAAISELVPGRTRQQCYNRWHDSLHSMSDETIARAGKWTTDEDIALKNAAEKHNGENWEAAAALVPGRTKRQCQNRWNCVLDSKKYETTARKGKWTKEEDSTLGDAIEKLKGEDWDAISELVPGRTRQQCYHRWHNSLHSKSDETIARVGTWTTEEDNTLTDAVQKHNGKDWTAISALVPGRKEKQCWDRWVRCLHQSRTTITEDEHGTTNEAPSLG
jgi:hypothetical protein